MGGIIPAVAATGQTVYAQLRDLATGQIANGAAFEVYNQAHWANYVIAQSEQVGSGFFTAGMPGYVPAGRYLATSYIVLGGSPASGDTPIYDTVIDWDGANIVGINSPVNIGKVNGSASAAVALGVSANAFVTGAAAAGTLSVTQMTTNLTGAQPNLYAGRTLIFTSGANAGRAVLITAYAVTGGLLTFVGYGNAGINVVPSVADTFLIL